MIKLEDFDSLYRYSFDLAFNRLFSDDLFLWDSADVRLGFAYLDAFKAFHNLKQELFSEYAVVDADRCIRGLELTADQLFDLFHKHLKLCTNKVAKQFIFQWWISLRDYVDGAVPELDSAYQYCKDATDAEAAQAEKDFGRYNAETPGKSKIAHTFKTKRVLEYRGHRFPIDDQWGAAWIKDKNGKIYYFSLEWDWWYPIDEYFDFGEYLNK